MKNTLLFLLLFSLQTLLAQQDSLVVSPDFLSKTQETVIDKYDYSRQSDYILYFPMKYARFIFTAKDKALLESISDTIVERIELVYTVFRRELTYDQVKLNKTRYEMLQWFFPEAFKSNLIEWRLMAQDGATDYETAKDYFHGFVIYLKPHRVTTEDGEIINTVMDRRIDESTAKVLETNEEIESVKNTLKQVFESTGTKTISETVVSWEEKQVWTGFYLHSNPKKRGKGKKYKTPGKDRPKEYYTKKIKKEEQVEKVVPDPDAKPTVSIETALGKVTTDTVVYNVFNRNMDQWADYVLVQDVTGSMYPYLTQTLIYLKKNAQANETEKFVFFNDGDKSPDGLIGRTGGTYYVSSSNPSEIEETAYAAMAGGKGGKAAENDIEAILHGYTKFPNCKGAVLIADNFSRVRDIVLIKRLVDAGKPVDVVICGAGKNGEVNIDYLYIAQLTGGKIHTLTESIEDLAQKGDGDVFKVGSQKFQMEGKRIKLIEQDQW